LDLQIHDGTDPGEGVSKSAEQSAIAEASVSSDRATSGDLPKERVC
jgi:hypothetical protein